MKRRKGDWFYMHLLNGEPAQFVMDSDGARLCVGSRLIKSLATSIEQVRREQRASKRFYKEPNAKDYSHVRIPRTAFKAEGEV